MLLRRATPLALAILALACEPSVPFDPATNPAAVDYAGFDPTGNPPSLPLPNDLALLESAISTQNPAQAALLKQWQRDGFPNDQEVPITVDFVREAIDPATGTVTRSAPQLDTSSIGPSNLLLLSLSASGAGAVAYDPPAAADYVVAGDHGTLTLHKAKDPATGSRRWPAGSEMVVAVRGGPAGVKVTGGAAGGLQPQAAMFLLLQDKNLTLPENLGLLPGDDRGQKLAAAAQLEAIRKSYLAPFAAIDASGAFNHREIATMSTFKVASTSRATHVETDPSSGRMPLPSDFLLGPDGHLLPELAAANGPFGALGAGLATLDGFSTTAMILMQTSSTIAASTVNKDSVFVYELGVGQPPVATRLGEVAEAPAKAPRFVAEPPPITQAVNGVAASTVIGLQPAVPVPVPGTPVVLSIPPLNEGTTYVVLVTDRVRDLNGDKLVRSTLGKILLLDPSISVVSTNGKSQLSGVSDAQAQGITQMRQAINLAAGALVAEKSASGLTRDDIVMAYTFRTQTMKSLATTLAALPYQNPVAGLGDTGRKVFGSFPGADGTIAAVVASYGVTGVPTSNIFAVIDTTITTFNKLTCPAGATGCADTGAFTPGTVPPNPEPIRMLVALPAPPYNGCTPGGATVCTIPLVVFRHGFTSWRGTMLALADRLNAQGIAVAAIDAAKHGDRSFCSADNQCAGGTCVPVPGMGAEGDAVPPGRCSTDFVRTGGKPAVSGNYFISGNLFRTRDTLRQDIVDQSQLIRVLSPNPRCNIASAPTAPDTCANQIVTATFGVQFDPSTISFVGQSLGAISGAVDAAANARIRKLALNVGGGTLADVFTQSPDFQPSVNALLATLGIQPGTAAFLQFVQVAKWVLDPADPVNYAVNLVQQPLPGPLSGGAAPPPRSVLGQMALCDSTVPNAFSLNLYGDAGLPTNGGANTAATSFTTFVAGGAAACPANAVHHVFLLDWATYGASITPQSQDDIAAFFLAGTPPPSSRSAP